MQLLRVMVAFATLLVSGCAWFLDEPPAATPAARTAEYVIGTGDSLQIFVWRNPELSVTVPVRPDGRISIPLVQDVSAAGQTPLGLAREIETQLSRFVRDPVVTVIVSGSEGSLDNAIRVVGEAVKPAAVPFRRGLTLLDVMISVGGLSEFADGNNARLIRQRGAETDIYHIRIADLVKDGDITANVELMPGDVVRIPERWF